MVRIIASSVAVQGPPPSGSSVVMVRVTTPANISAAEGVYMVVGSVIRVNIPVPEVDHAMDDAEPPNEPKVLNVEPAQITSSTFAETVAIGLIVKVIGSDTAKHGPAGSSEVMVSITEPASISTAEGVYVAAISVLLSKVPVPEVAQVIEEAPPLNEPDNVYVEPEQMTSLPPEETMAIGSIVRIMASLTTKQGPAGSSVVMVRVTTPAKISAADGV